MYQIRYVLFWGKWKMIHYYLARKHKFERLKFKYVYNIKRRFLRRIQNIKKKKILKETYKNVKRRFLRRILTIKIKRQNKRNKIN
jgi:hypothetical protein